jgi:hypothetical protein
VIAVTVAVRTASSDSKGEVQYGRCIGPGRSESGSSATRRQLRMSCQSFKFLE